MTSEDLYSRTLKLAVQSMQYFQNEAPSYYRKLRYRSLCLLMTNKEGSLPSC